MVIFNDKYGCNWIPYGYVFKHNSSILEAFLLQLIFNFLIATLPYQGMMFILFVIYIWSIFLSTSIVASGNPLLESAYHFFQEMLLCSKIVWKRLNIMVAWLNGKTQSLEIRKTLKRESRQASKEKRRGNAVSN